MWRETVSYTSTELKGLGHELQAIGDTAGATVAFECAKIMDRMAELLVEFEVPGAETFLPDVAEEFDD